jgi:hypothetical protein
MERYVVATRLKPGAAPAAEELLSSGPPFDRQDFERIRARVPELERSLRRLGHERAAR